MKKEKFFTLGAFEEFLKAAFIDEQSFQILRLFEKYPWVITKKDGQDWYYQVLNIDSLHLVNYVSLGRDGKEVQISINEFITEFELATPEQVLQHYKFMKESGRTYRVSYTGKFKFIPKEEKEVKPKDAEFYMVTLKQGIGSKIYHESYEKAEAEAIRLSKKEGKKAYILGVVGVVETTAVTTHEVKVKKY